MRGDKMTKIIKLGRNQEERVNKTRLKRTLKPIGTHKATYSLYRITIYNLLQGNDLKRGFQDLPINPIFATTERGELIRTL